MLKKGHPSNRGVALFFWAQKMGPRCVIPVKEQVKPLAF